MANDIKKNIEKGGVAGIAVSIATFIVYGGAEALKLTGVDIAAESRMMLVVALSGVITGIMNYIKHRRR